MAYFCQTIEKLHFREWCAAGKSRIAYFRHAVRYGYLCNVFATGESITTYPFNFISFYCFGDNNLTRPLLVAAGYSYSIRISVLSPNFLHLILKKPIFRCLGFGRRLRLHWKQRQADADEAAQGRGAEYHYQRHGGGKQGFENIFSFHCLSSDTFINIFRRISPFS